MRAHARGSTCPANRECNRRTTPARSPSAAQLFSQGALTDGTTANCQHSGELFTYVQQRGLAGTNHPYHSNHLAPLHLQLVHTQREALADSRLHVHLRLQQRS